ncbi:MAG: lipopolysaccharide biosynthesis protein [Pseudomonas profundi]
MWSFGQCSLFSDLLPEADIKASTEHSGSNWKQRIDVIRNELRNGALRNIVAVITGTAGAQALTMVFMPIVARLYGPESYGVLGVFMGLVMMVVPIAALTFPMAIALARKDAEALALCRLSLWVAAALSFGSAVVLSIFGTPLANRIGVEEAAPYLMLLPVVMFFGGALETAQQWLFRKQLFHVTAKIAVLHSLTHNLVRCAGGLIYASPAVLVTTTAIGSFLHGSMLFAAIRRWSTDRKLEEEPKPSAWTAAELVRTYKQFPLFRAPQMFINAISQNLPTLMLAAYFGAAAAGYFALCRQTLSMPTHLVGKSVADVYYPKLTRAIQQHDRITGMLIRAVAGLAVVGLIPFGMVFCFGPWLFSVVFGAAWEEAGEFARWLALAEYAIFISRPCTVAFPALSIQGLGLAVEIASTGLRIVALLIGALILGTTLGTITVFAFANVIIYVVVIGVVLLKAYSRDHHECRKT